MSQWPSRAWPLLITKSVRWVCDTAVFPEGRGNQPCYESTVTSEQLGQRFNVSYGPPGLFASGKVITDTVTVSGFKEDWVAVDQMNVQVATEMGDWDISVSGVFGMGFGIMNSSTFPGCAFSSQV